MYVPRPLGFIYSESTNILTDSSQPPFPAKGDRVFISMAGRRAMGKPPSCGVSCTHVEFNNSPLTTVAMGIYFPTPRLPPAPYHLPTKLPLAFQTPLLPEGPRQKNHMYSSWEASQPDASGRQKEGVCGCVGCGHEQGGGCSS